MKEIAIIALSGLVPLLIGLWAIRRKVAGAAGAQTSELESKVRQLVDELDALAAKSKTFSSAAQLQLLESQIAADSSSIESEKARLKEIELKLSKQQRAVEDKEGQQQQLKTSKESDEIKLEELLARYLTVKDESVALERELASCLKSLETILNEVELNDNQRAFLQELVKSLTEAGSRLRDLLMEYNTVNDRLAALRQQHKDLEEEYTKLVERQLGD